MGSVFNVCNDGGQYQFHIWGTDMWIQIMRPNGVK